MRNLSAIPQPFHVKPKSDINIHRHGQSRTLYPLWRGNHLTSCDVDHLYDKKKICPDLTITRNSAIIIIYIRIYLYIHCIKLFQSIDNTINLNFPEIKKITIAELISYITNHQNDLIRIAIKQKLSNNSDFVEIINNRANTHSTSNFFAFSKLG